MVDLDGSIQKKRVNSETFVSVATQTPLKVELGGGIRTMSDIEFYAENGISRIILGSVALKSPELVKEAVTLLPRDGLRAPILISLTLLSVWKLSALTRLFIPTFQRTEL